MQVSVVQLADSAGCARTKEVCHKVDVLAGKMSVVRQMSLVEGGLEGLVMRVAEEAMKVSSLSGSLDLFLGKVSGLMRDAEREDGGARCT